MSAPHYMVSLRSGNGLGRGIGVRTVLVGDAMAPGNRMRVMPSEELEALAQGRDVLFATHGFNVSYEQGLRALGALQNYLALGSQTLFIGILWPGDYWIPAINYPWEASDAVTSGNAIADWCGKGLSGAASFSFISHSLGGRLILQAALRMKKVKMLCLTAAAVDDDVLTSKQYAAAYEHCETVHVLTSRCDQVLKLAYPAGDFFSDLFGDNDSAFRGALGRYGPRPFPSGGHAAHRPIPKTAKYGHGDYMPSGGQKWRSVADYMKAMVYGQPSPWP